VLKVSNKNRRTGSAVSLYLPYDVKYLHDLAKEDPNINCSEVYSDALRALLGNIEPKHPLEVIRENQKKKIKELESMLNTAKGQLAMTEERLPKEIARIFFMENVLGKTEYSEMKQLRTILFFDTNSPSQNISIPLNDPDGMLNRYIELIGKYEATKHGQSNLVISSINLQDRHPIEFNTSGGRICFNSNDVEVTCQNLQRLSGDPYPKYTESNIATNLCDDLVYRCDACLKTRESEHKNRKLKPYWELDTLTTTQLIVETQSSKKSVGSTSKQGLLARNETLLFESRRMALISYSKTQWANENQELATELELLNSERNMAVIQEDGVLTPQWNGSNRWRKGTRDRMLAKMRHDGLYYDEYTQKLQRVVKLNELQSSFIKEKIGAWYDSGCTWDEEISLVRPDHDVMLESHISTLAEHGKRHITYVPSQREVIVSLLNDARVIGLQLP